jgi:hypothetical protein
MEISDEAWRLCALEDCEPVFYYETGQRRFYEATGSVSYSAARIKQAEIESAALRKVWGVDDAGVL